MSTLVKTLPVFVDKCHILLSEQSNVRRLHNIDYVKRNCDISVDTHLIKQGSDEWKEIRHNSFVTASTAFNACGFRSVQAVNEHFDEFVYKKGERTFTDLENERMAHGREHEVRI